MNFCHFGERILDFLKARKRFPVSAESGYAFGTGFRHVAIVVD